MKKFLIIVIIITSLGCHKESQLKNMTHSETRITSAEIAQQHFAEALSKAVSESEPLRSFIKKESLKQFDNDYDVFYPFIKDFEVIEGKTFRSFILDYIDEDSLLNIEASLPKLTILVPNWEWCGGFSVVNWNTKEEGVAVGCSMSKEKIIYSEGECVGILSDDQIPIFPTLIIKENERVTCEPSTKNASSMEYKIMKFDNNSPLETKVEHQYIQIDIDEYPNVEPYLPPVMLSNKVISAYNATKDYDYIAQRDNIYYDMTHDKSTGIHNYRVSEVLKRFKFISFLDDFREANAGINEYTMNGPLDYKGNDSAKSVSELREYFYAGGNIEMHFHFMIPNSQGGVTTLDKRVNVPFGEAFALSKVDLDYRHKTWFCKDWYVYSIKDTYIYPKWVDVDLELPDWDIFDDSAVITIYVEEHDTDTETQITKTVDNTQTHNFEASGNNDFSGINMKIGYKYELGNVTKTSTNVVITTTTGSDNLGMAQFSYIDPVVLSYDIEKGYKMKVISTGTVDMMIVPTYE